jgi:hypothetical protein
MPEIQEILADRTLRAAGLDELGHMYGKEAKMEDIDSIDPFGTTGAGIQLTGITFDLFFPAIDVSGHAKP